MQFTKRLKRYNEIIPYGACICMICTHTHTHMRKHKYKNTRTRNIQHRCGGVAVSIHIGISGVARPSGSLYSIE